jgi:hypothetical protein
MTVFELVGELKGMPFTLMRGRRSIICAKRCGFFKKQRLN